MAIITDFTNLKGNSVGIKSSTNLTAAGDDNSFTLVERTPDGTDIENTDTLVPVNGGVRGVRFHSDTFIPNLAVVTDSDGNSVTGSTVVPNSTVGDIYLETTEDRLHERVADTDPDGDGTSDTETWSFLSDFTGSRGASVASAGGTSTAVQFVDSDGNNLTGTVNLKGDAGSGFNTYADSTAYAIGDTVISNNADDIPVPTQWRAIDTVVDTNTIDPVEGDVWSEIPTVSQITSSTPTTFETSGLDAMPSYVTMTADDNPDPVPSGFPGIQLVFTTDGSTPYNKFNSTTASADQQPRLLFTTASNVTNTTNAGFQSAGGADDVRYVFYRFNHTTNLAASDIISELATNITSGSDCNVHNSTATTGETWNLDATVSATNTATLEIRATGGGDLQATVGQINGGMGWTATNVAATSATLIPDTGQTFNLGSIVIYSNEAYMWFGAIPFNSDTTHTSDEDLPDSATSDWKQITN